MKLPSPYVVLLPLLLVLQDTTGLRNVVSFKLVQITDSPDCAAGPDNFAVQVQTRQSTCCRNCTDQGDRGWRQLTTVVPGQLLNTINTASFWIAASVIMSCSLLQTARAITWPRQRMEGKWVLDCVTILCHWTRHWTQTPAHKFAWSSWIIVEGSATVGLQLCIAIMIRIFRSKLSKQVASRIIILDLGLLWMLATGTVTERWMDATTVSQAYFKSLVFLIMKRNHFLRALLRVPIINLMELVLWVQVFPEWWSTMSLAKVIVLLTPTYWLLTPTHWRMAWRFLKSEGFVRIVHTCEYHRKYLCSSFSVNSGHLYKIISTALK